MSSPSTRSDSLPNLSADPACNGPHKGGQRLLRWQHTETCKKINAWLFRKGPASDSPELPEDATIVERGRAVGAI